jgi:hypothetical protein
MILRSCIGPSFKEVVKQNEHDNHEGIINFGLVGSQTVFSSWENDIGLGLSVNLTWTKVYSHIISNFENLSMSF